jgi:hypothetical protein
MLQLYAWRAHNSRTGQRGRRPNNRARELERSVISGGRFRQNEAQTGGRARVNVVCKYQQASMMEGVSSDRKRAFGMSEIRLDYGGPFCLFAASLTKKNVTRRKRVDCGNVSLCSSRYWAARAPTFKVELRLNPCQSKAATDTGSSRNATTHFCEVANFQRNNVSTKKTQRPIYSKNHWQSVHKSRPREDGRGCVVRSLNTVWALAQV